VWDEESGVLLPTRFVGYVGFHAEPTHQQEDGVAQLPIEGEPGEHGEQGIGAKRPEQTGIHHIYSCTHLFLYALRRAYLRGITA
jgi:hypothetical protein